MPGLTTATQIARAGAAKRVARLWLVLRALAIWPRYRNFSMVPTVQFVRNLVLCGELAPPGGCIVECGVWRGGMSAAMADMLPGRTHYLFDSFEGLPPASADLDGEKALAYQRANTDDNCRAERSFAETAMRMSRARQSHFVQGWFSDTVKRFAPAEPIAVLRLDGDWYELTMQCLTALFPRMMLGGLVLIDDYYHFDGCARAVHDYLSHERRRERIREFGRVCYLLKVGEPTFSVE